MESSIIYSTTRGDTNSNNEQTETDRVGRLTKHKKSGNYFDICLSLIQPHMKRYHPNQSVDCRNTQSFARFSMISFRKETMVVTKKCFH